MKKASKFFFVLLLIVSNFFDLQSRDQHDIHAYLSVSPASQGDPGTYARAASYASGSNYKAPQFSLTCNFQNDFHHESIKLPSVEQFQKTRKLLSYGTFEYKVALLRSSGSVAIAGKNYPVTKEDYDLIDKICRDNSHYDHDKLWKQLLDDGSINHAAILMKYYQPGYFLKSDVYINPAYFTSLVDAKDRQSSWKAASLDAIAQRHKVEKNNIESRHKAELQKVKKISKSEGKKVELVHKEEVAKFDKQKKYDIDHWNGVRTVQVVVSQKNVVSQKTLQQLNDQQQSIKNKINQSKYAYEASFVKVMTQQEQALQQSLTNPKISLQKFSMQPHVIGFLQAQGIDIAQFQHIEGLQIQHQLTHELIDVLNEVTQYAMHHYDEKDLIVYFAQLAQATQQANHEAALVQAVQGTNCCHGITHYLKGLVSGVGQAYQQFQTALDYFETIIDSYGALIVQHAAQGALLAHGLEGIVAAGMLAAPTATVAATGIMIGATAYVMAPVCLQACMQLKDFGGACIAGNWNKVIQDLDDFGKFMSSKSTVARMAEFAGGATIPTPNLNYVVNQVSSLRPVLTRVQNEAGQTISKLYVMSKDRVQQVYQQSVELLQSQDFLNFNLMYEKILGCHFFDILPKSHPALAGAFSGLESSVMNSAEQTMMTQLFTQADRAVAGEVIKNEVMHAVYPLVENINQPVSFVQNIVQQEIQQALQQGNQTIGVDLFTPITTSRATELTDLSKNIRQLQDLAKYTNNFQNLNELIPEDIAYLNRIYELQSYRAQIKNFLDTYKPYFIYDGQQYFIEDIASYHIHAGDYFIKDNPGGAHSNYQGQKLSSFNPELITNGPLGTTDVMLYNSRSQNRKKPSSIYPKSWSEFVCDLKAIEVMMSGNAEIKPGDVPGVLRIKGFTAENLEIIIHYDVKNKRIRTHYPNIL